MRGETSKGDSVVAIVSVKYDVEDTESNFCLCVGVGLLMKSYLWRRRVLAIIHELSNRISPAPLVLVNCREVQIES